MPNIPNIMSLSYAQINTWSFYY